MWNHYKVEQTKHTKQAGIKAGVWSRWRHHPKSMGQIGRTYCNEIQLIETFVESDSATDFKGFEALHNNVVNIDDQLLCSNVQTEVEQMYDELRRFFETFQWNINKLTLNFYYKYSCICGKWLYMTCSNNKVWTLFFVKKIAHLTRMLT